MDKLMRFIDVMNAFRLCAALAVVDLIAAGVYKIKEVWGAKGHNTNVLDRDSDTRIYIPCRVRNRRSNNGCNIPRTTEEKIMVLNTMRMGATWYEKNLIDEISDDLIELDAIKYLKTHGEGTNDKE